MLLKKLVVLLGHQVLKTKLKRLSWPLRMYEVVLSLAAEAEQQVLNDMLNTHSLAVLDRRPAARYIYIYSVTYILSYAW